MARFDDLILAIHHIKARRLGTNLELASFCGFKPSQTSDWFWSVKPSPVPRAGVTLRALEWVGQKLGVTTLLFPDWESLRLEIYLSRYREKNALDGMRRRFDVGDAQIFTSGIDASEWATKIGTTEERIVEVVPYPWDAPAPEPDGNFALDLLAYHHRTQKSRLAFLDFYLIELDRGTGEDDPTITYIPLPGGLSASQRQLMIDAERLVPIYFNPKFDPGPWLRPILM